MKSHAQLCIAETAVAMHGRITSKPSLKHLAVKTLGVMHGLVLRNLNGKVLTLSSCEWFPVGGPVGAALGACFEGNLSRILAPSSGRLHVPCSWPTRAEPKLDIGQPLPTALPLSVAAS